MNRIHEIPSAQALAPFENAPGLPTFDAAQIAEHAADLHLVLADGARILARCSLWWASTPSYQGQRAGIIGHFAALEEKGAASLLEHACKYLQGQNCARAVGPMDGSTWRSYRLVTEELDEPPFFLEPQNPRDWPRFWRAAGFESIARYSSHINTDLSHRDPRIERVAQRLGESGIEIRPLDMADYEAELHRIFELSRVSFRPNFLYTPLEEEKFAAMYSRLKPYIGPELALIATRESRPVGFLFALPDWAQKQRGQQIDTAIIKTVAVLPGRANAGLGNLLAARCHATAREMGYTRAVHALMHDGNHSRNLSGHYARPMRRYELFGRAL